MLTRVVAKQAKKTKVKTKFVNGKKKFKRILSCLFGGRGKVQICPVGSVRTRSAHRLSSQLFVAVSMPNIAELVLFGFFRPQPWFLRRSEHICQEKHQHFHADRQLVTKKEISIKIKLKNDNKHSWPSGLISGFRRRRG